MKRMIIQKGNLLEKLPNRFKNARAVEHQLSERTLR